MPEIKKVVITKSEPVKNYRKVYYDNGQYNNCFEKGLFDKIDNLVGKPALVTVEKRGQYYNITDVAENNTGGSSSSVSGSGSSSVDYARPKTPEENFVIIKQSQMANAVAAIAPVYHGLINKLLSEADKDVNPDEILVPYLEKMENDIKIEFYNLVREVWGYRLPHQSRKEDAEQESLDIGETSDDDIPF